MRCLPFLIALFCFTTLFAQSPHGDTFNAECTNCHNVESWAVSDSEMTFDHDTTLLKLEGQHTLVSCRTCHTSLQFEKAQTECSACHTDMHESTLGNECGSCHTPVSWLVSNVAPIHYEGRFPLVGNHLMAACADCHASSSTLKFEPVGILCFDCHSADYAATQSPNHIQGNFSTECSDCHDPASPSWSASNVNHSFFPLEGGHSLTCSDCHASGTFTGLSQVCYSCHQPTYQGTQNPPHVQLNFPTECNQCHTLNPGWAPAAFTIHDQYFALTGAHKTAECTQCHSGGVYTGTPSTCVECHQANYNGTANPNHQSVGFGTDCATCHTTTAWQPASFDHDVQFFPIYSGKHKNEWNACSDCHTNSSSYADFSCITCHEHNQSDMNQQHSDVQGYQYASSACFSCHPDGNSEGAFNHSTSPFPLTGAHSNAECALCHANGYPNTPTDCVSCHQANYNSSVNPNHQQLALSTDCQACHTTNPGWAPAAFAVHDTYYALTGAHSTISGECLTCHNGNYTTTPNECSGCHSADYNAATNPNHSALTFPTTCDQCHTTNPGWAPATFTIHDQYFALTGIHTTTECAQCHPGGAYTGTPNTCIGCHQTEYNNTTNPNHQTTGFGIDCAGCHTPAGWTPATFDHDVQYFPIYSGKHNNEWNACTDCHTNPASYADVSCITCHEHNQADMDQQHAAVQGYQYTSSACLSCHPDGSGDGAFNHSTSAFPLTGAHLTTECALCHTSGYPNTPTECFACHQTDYNGSTNPNHQTLALSTECQTCHTTNPGWAPAAFAVHDQYFALVGAHTTTTCAQCHVGGVYTGTPNTCVGCHQTDYNNTTNPNHQTAGFGTDCAGCHTPSGWTPATFDHDVQYFPIYSGSHNNQWNSCADCHTNAASYADFSCITCHDHNQADMDQQHSDVQGYQYVSSACLSCHPDGSGEGAFNHATSIFPLTGAHLTTECALCHTNGYPNTPTQCSACHQSDYNASVNPNHQTLALSTDCQTCHTTNPDWQPASFAVHNNYYALTGAHANVAGQCLGCHNGNYTTTPNVCSGCHTADYNATTNPDHETLALPLTCDQCHTTNPGWTPATFAIHEQYYVIAGAHTSLSCAQCHAGGVYTGTPNTCVGCHQTDFNQTTNPNHQAAGFPTDCISCHTQVSWSPANFNHDGLYFPIYSGNHNGEWNTCADCHQNPSDFSQFECILCHEHNRTSTDNDHRGVQGYQYNSAACYDCHPNGNSKKRPSEKENEDFQL